MTLCRIKKLKRKVEVGAVVEVVQLNREKSGKRKKRGGILVAQSQNLMKKENLTSNILDKK